MMWVRSTCTRRACSAAALSRTSGARHDIASTSCLISNENARCRRREDSRCPSAPRRLHRTSLSPSLSRARRADLALALVAPGGGGARARRSVSGARAVRVPAKGPCSCARRAGAGRRAPGRRRPCSSFCSLRRRRGVRPRGCGEGCNAPAGGARSASRPRESAGGTAREDTTRASRRGWPCSAPSRTAPRSLSSSGRAARAPRTRASPACTSSSRCGCSSRARCTSRQSPRTSR